MAQSARPQPAPPTHAALAVPFARPRLGFPVRARAESAARPAEPFRARMILGRVGPTSVLGRGPTRPYGLQGCSMPTHSCWLARRRWSSLADRSPGPRDEHAHVRPLRWVLGGLRCRLVQFDRVRQNSSARLPMKWRRSHTPWRCWTASGEIMIPIGTVGVATRHMPTAGNGTRARHCGWQPWSRERSRPR